jgi:26S proteasome regulatory subunit N9
LRVLHNGDVAAFNALTSAHRADIAGHPALASSGSVLQEKIVLLALMELALQRPAGSRSISFSDIAAATQTADAQVEWVVMRAFSLGLVSGTIDQVDSVVHVSAVKPRVLNLAQISNVKARVDEWAVKTGTALDFVESKINKELFL